MDELQERKQQNLTSKLIERLDYALIFYYRCDELDFTLNPNSNQLLATLKLLSEYAQIQLKTGYFKQNLESFFQESEKQLKIKNNQNKNDQTDQIYDFKIQAEKVISLLAKEHINLTLFYQNMQTKEQEDQQVKPNKINEPKSVISKYFLEEGITQEMKTYVEVSRFASLIIFYLMIFCSEQSTNYLTIFYRQIAAEFGRVSIIFKQNSFKVAVPNQTKISALILYCPYYLIAKIIAKLKVIFNQNQQLPTQNYFLDEMRIVFFEEKKPSREMQICIECTRHLNLVGFIAFLIAMLWLWPNPTDTPFWSLQFVAQIGRVGVLHLTKLLAIFTIFFHSLTISFLNYLWKKIKYWNLNNNKFLRFQTKDESLYQNDFLSKSDFTFELEQKNSKSLNLSQ